MMTSVGSSRARGSWEQTQTQNQTQHKQRPQATAEQIRLAQMISDHNDADFEEKVKQLIDITGKDQDESMIALHDCNGDVNRAINVLLEGSPDTDSWEMVGRKKGLSGQKENAHMDVGEEGKENRERGGERDVARRRGGAPRRGRGASRGREFRGQENGLDGSKVGGASGRGTERGRRGRGRGGRGGSGRRGGRFSAQGMGQIDKGAGFDFSGDERTFNPADYAEPVQAEESYAGGSTWNNTGSLEPDDGARLEFSGVEGTNYPGKFDSAPGAWRTAPEEWGTEDWNEDLSETKIFTASSVAAMSLPQENVTITAGQRIDLAVLLGKTPPSTSELELAPLEASQPPSLSQALVFSNSKQGGTASQPPTGAPYGQHSMANMLSKSFGDVVEPKAGTGSSTSGSQFLEQFKTAQALAQLAAQHSQAGPASVPSSAWDTSPSSLGQYDMKPQPEPSVHAPFPKRQPFQPATSAASSMMDAFLQDKVSPSSVSSTLHPPVASTPSAPPPSPLSKPPAPGTGPQMSPGSSDNHSSSPQPLQQHKLKQQKKRTSISTKIPSLAVEMPGSADISGLNLQFGALQFGSEPVLPEYDSAPATSASVSQAPSSLYTSASSESAPALPSPDQGYQGGSLSGSAPSYPSQTVTSAGPGQPALYEQRSTQTRRYPPSVSTSPQKDIQPGKNGFSSIQTTQSMEAASGAAVPTKPTSEAEGTVSVSSMASLTDGTTVPVSLLATPNQTSLGSLGHGEDLAPSATSQPQHSSSLSTQQNSLAPSSTARTPNSSLLHSSVDSADSSLHSSSFPSAATAAVSSAPPAPSSASASAVLNAPPPSVSTVSAQPCLGPVSSLSMGLNSAGTAVPPVVAAAASCSATVTVASTSASARSSVASGKAPPNLPPGVPPLLPNPYIMAPGLLHPYPPQVYGYDDLQMLQTRIPLDYYSIPFATPTTALTGREGSLTSNPYSAELTKFGRGEAPSPAPATTLAQPQQSQPQTHHTTQQPFLNPALPPGYSYTSLPYYTGVPGMPNPFQYGPAVFPVAPTSSKQHGVNVSVNASATAFQQASGYGSHGYSTGVSVTSSNTGVPDISGSVYTKTQSFDKQGFHAGTPAASFSLPSALGSGGPINPPAAAGYAPAPFMHILAPHQQPHSQILHHHLQQDGQSGTGQRSQNSSIQQKSQVNKSAYNSYNWGAN
ncbi:ubiquitin-associated protein 2-like isoform X5 [Brienomyrus brachyistius]|uniref:ubiquitin-associated protein 2-like isoform X5 n=1 Tax=Brienomyrus brachyistius TaxID=42636 RepID=UPI0020B20BAA|nr:ubiquitin-associated protein 2-like isoform X5 [Brienomyrus brachyistius]